MTIPSLATAQGWPARAARGSAIVAAIDNVAPKQPARFAAWGRTISEAPYPTALAPLDDPPDPGAPPVAKMPAAVDERVRQSVVKVQGQACSQIQEGSGWVVEPHLVITNAHVVAGERNTLVTDPQGGHPHDATVVAFDARRDLAVLSVPNLDAPALVRARGKAGAIGAVYGHPGGNALRPAPARIGEEIRASGSDIYRSSSDVIRHVFILAADLHPGDSGAPLVNQSGAVMGVAFAIDPAKSGTAYALTDAEIDPVLQMVTGRRVSTGGCLVG
jgi:S1-C subfamily serine protease